MTPKERLRAELIAAGYTGEYLEQSLTAARYGMLAGTERSGRVMHYHMTGGAISRKPAEAQKREDAAFLAGQRDGIAEWIAAHGDDGSGTVPREFAKQKDQDQMTTLETLTFEQVAALEAEALKAGDKATYVDCHTVCNAYAVSTDSDLAAVIAGAPSEVQEAAARIVAAIRNAEAQS